MLLSFSVDYMRSMVEAGFRQYSGQDVGSERVKRQTIRALGPRNERLLKIDNPSRELDLHLWWKSRTPARAFFGKVEKWTVRRLTIKNHRGLSVNIQTDPGAPWASPLQPSEIGILALADGFIDTAFFMTYFVPNSGDVFNGALFKW